MLKVYYAKQDAEKTAGTGDTSQKLTLIKTSADSLKKSDISSVKSVFTGYNIEINIPDETPYFCS